VFLGERLHVCQRRQFDGGILDRFVKEDQRFLGLVAFRGQAQYLYLFRQLLTMSCTVRMVT
jgi:hypothetical protein